MRHDHGVEGVDPHVDRLAAAMDAEVRAEQAAYEAEALRAEQRARSLADVARELVVRGDVVEVVVAGRTLTGAAAHAGRDLLVLDTAHGVVDVALPAITLLQVVRRVRDGGRPPGRGATTLRARMTEHEVAGLGVTVLLADGGTVDGAVAAAAADHLLVTAARGPAVVPWPAVAAVWPLARPVV